MKYLVPLLDKSVNVFPLLGNQFAGKPHIFNLSSSGSLAGEIDTSDFDNFQNAIFDHLKNSGCDWGIGPYLEERKTLLRNYPQIIDEGRVYHLGVDIIVAGGTKLFAPISGTVYESAFEDGHGNYGGYVILRHELDDTVFYSFYGHLDNSRLPEVGAEIPAGSHFATVGSTAKDSGGWFTHTHLQLFTEQGKSEGYFEKGYTDLDGLSVISRLCPSPYLLFRY